ncbi:MAG: DUF4386 domain-containing protein [Maritimibacter sp.]
MPHNAQRSALLWLRLTYPLWAVVGMSGLLWAQGQLYVHGDAAATAGNLIAHPGLARYDVVAALLTQLLYIAAPLLLFRLFEPVSRAAGAVMVVFALVAVPIAMTGTLGKIAAGQLAASNPELAYTFYWLSDEATIMASIFWGLWLFPLGWLVLRSRYFPAFTGWALYLGGIGYVLISFGHYIVPDMALLSIIGNVLTMGELVFLLWLIVLGAKLPEAG